MLLIFSGKDTYRSRQKLEAVKKRYQKLHPGGFRMHSWESPNFLLAEIQDALNTQSMFKEKKLLIFINAFGNAELIDFLCQHMDTLASDKEIIAVLLQEGEIPGKGKAVRELCSRAELQQDFAPLSESALRKWIENQCTKRGVRISPGVVSRLCRDFHGDMWQLNNELHKLVAFARTEQNEITQESAEHLLSGRPEYSVFQLLDAVAAKNKREALALLREYDRRGEQFFSLLALFNTQMRNMLAIKELQERGELDGNAVRQLEMHPYAFKKASAAAQAFKRTELLNYYRRLFELDRRVKTGQTTPARGLELFVAQM